MLSKDEARRIAVNIAKLLRLIRWFAMVVTAASHTRLPLADGISGTEAERKNNDQSNHQIHTR
jgi:hypothetical protein